MVHFRNPAFLYFFSIIPLTSDILPLTQFHIPTIPYNSHPKICKSMPPPFLSLKLKKTAGSQNMVHLPNPVIL